MRLYNTELKTFPGVIWASTLYKSDKPMQEFTVAEDVSSRRKSSSERSRYARSARSLPVIAWLCLVCACAAQTLELSGADRAGRR